MKKLILITGIILITCVLVSVLAAPRAAAGGAAAADAAQGFVIKDSGGRVAVFKSGENDPFLTTETYTATLPKNDVSKLKKGIDARDANELRRLLEDYCS